MAMKKIVRKYDGSAEFIIGDHYVNVKKLVKKADGEFTGYATQVGDRYVVTAGTLIMNGDEPLKSTAPVGLCFRDVDVTDGDAMIAVTVHAVVDRTALPAALTYEQEAALKGIVFVNGEAPEAEGGE